MTDRGFVQELLHEPTPRNFQELDRFFPGRIRTLKGLSRAIIEFTQFQQPEVHDFNFYRDLLPDMIAWKEIAETAAIDARDRVLPANKSGSVHFTRDEVRNTLAGIFLSHSSDTFGFTFISFFTSHEQVSIEKIKCLLNYFYHSGQGGVDINANDDRPGIIYGENGIITHKTGKSGTSNGSGASGRNILTASHEPGNIITFVRHTPAQYPDWTRCEQTIQKDSVRIHSGPMEDSLARTIVAFSNRKLLNGELGPECSHESILFSTCPELYIALIIFSDPFNDDETGLVSGIRMISETSGFQNTFAFRGTYAITIKEPAKSTYKSASGQDDPVDDPDDFKEKFTTIRCPERDVLFMDGSQALHFRDKVNLRDFNKLYSGFSILMNRTISTGKWGCNEFGGDPVHKFLQQLCVARLFGFRLDYSCFGDEDHEYQVREIMRKILSGQRDQSLTVPGVPSPAFTIAEIYYLTKEFSNASDMKKRAEFKSFYDYFINY